MARKRAPKRGVVESGGEYRFWIDAYSPETLPLARLAEYLTELAKLFGDTAAVHFSRLEAGSTVAVQKIDREARPKVRERLLSLERGDAPKDARIAYKSINHMLRADNAVGVLQTRKGSTPVLKFPGRESREERFPMVKEHGSIDGIVMRVGGTDDTVPVLLQSEGQQISGCHANKKIAKELAVRLFEPVRLSGIGKWRRDPGGDWNLEEFRIESFEALRDATLATAFAELRKVPGEWTPAAYGELKLLREGPVRRKRGRS